MPGERYFPELAGGEEVMLQGVVDLYAEKDGAVTVVDFKTDYVTALFGKLQGKNCYFRERIGKILRLWGAHGPADRLETGFPRRALRPQALRP